MFRVRSRTKTILLTLLCLMVATSGCSGGDAKPDEAPTESASTTDEPGATAVSFEAADMTIHGTLVRPEGEGPFPAVVLIAGSGPTDRDWNNPLMPGKNGSAKLLARALADAGIASLRYDKRGTGETKVPDTLAWEDYLAEQKAALALLRGQDFVDDEAVYVAGHSEGGLHGLRLLQEPDVSVDGLILLSTPGRSTKEVLLWQIEAQLKAAGQPAEAIATHQAKLEAALDRFAAGEQVDPAQASSYPGVQQLFQMLQAPASVEFGRALLTFDPAAALRATDEPTLLVTGGKDIQVDPSLDAGVLKQVAEDEEELTVVIAPDADHVLKEEELPREGLSGAVAVGRYNAPDRRLDPVVVDAIVAWVKAQAAK